jgi:hypothetical protein
MHTAKNVAASATTALLLCMALSGCTKLKQNDPREVHNERVEAKRQQDACASRSAYDRLKGLLFDQAIGEHLGDRSALDGLADYSFVRMEAPVVKSWDSALDLTKCSGRLVLEVPAGARQAFGGEQHLHADIDYSAQAAADGKGFVYHMKGAEPIVEQLAAFNLNGRAYRPPPAIDEVQTEPQASEPKAMAHADAPSPPHDERPSGVVPAHAGPQLSMSSTPVNRPRAAREYSVVRQPAPDPFYSARGRPHEDIPEGQGGEATVRAFYAALGRGNGPTASAQVIPEKRSSGAFSPEAISRFYGRLPEPLQLTAIIPLSDDAYRVAYRYSAGRSSCHGSAIVTLVNRDGQDFIRAIHSLSGC